MLDLIQFGLKLYISETRGIRQKYPLSALVFVFFSVEIMALRIKKRNKDIMRFQIKINEQTHSINISRLEDDTTLWVCLSPKTIYLLLFRFNDK